MFDADVERDVFDRQGRGGKQNVGVVAVRILFIKIRAALDAVFSVGVHVDRACAADGDVRAVLAFDDRVFNVGVKRLVGVDVVVVEFVVGEIVDCARRGKDRNAAALIAGDGCRGSRSEGQAVQHKGDIGDVFLDDDRAVCAIA